jgi:diguanylate cyclase (GGDEF)-like protein
MHSSLFASVADTTSHRDRDSINHAVAGLVLDFLNAESAIIYRLVDEGAGPLLTPCVSLTAANRGGQEPTLSQLPTAQELRLFPIWAECVDQHQPRQLIDAGGNISGAWPIESERDVSGILVVDGMRELVPRDVELIGAILRILKNHLAALDYGERDTLTGMLNRKTFEASFQKLRQRLRVNSAARSTVEPSWLALADIDKFKSINDSHGHLFGDEVLLLVAQQMAKCFRGADQLFRFGGEEFVIVLDQASEAGARIAFDRFRAAVEAFEFPQIGHVTLSLGYSRINPDDAATNCVERADAALYYAKNHGRNNVRNFEELVASGALAARTESADTEIFYSLSRV